MDRRKFLLGAAGAAIAVPAVAVIGPRVAKTLIEQMREIHPWLRPSNMRSLPVGGIPYRTGLPLAQWRKLAGATHNKKPDILRNRILEEMPWREGIT